MDRRFLQWLLLSFVIMVAWQTFVLPPPKPRPAAPPGDNPPADAAGADGAAAVEPPAEPPAESAGDGPAAARQAAVASLGARAEEAAAGPPAPPFLMLGSLDPASPYRMLVTLAARGAAVRRIELNSPFYLNTDERGGYAGELELEPDAAGGLRVLTVGPGTPAARGGLQVGDRLTAAGSEGVQPLARPEDWRTLLDRSRAGRELTVDVIRDGAPQSLRVALQRRPLNVLRPESENLRLRDQPVPPDFRDVPSFPCTLARVDDVALTDGASELPGIALRDAAWRLTEHTEDAATFTQTLPQYGLTIEKKYRLAKVAEAAASDRDAPAYHLLLEFRIVNGGETARRVAYHLDGPSGLPLEGWWFAQKSGRAWTVGLRDVVGRYFGAQVQQQGPAAILAGEAEAFQGGSMAWAGVDAQYFSAILMPETTREDEVWVERVQPVPLAAAPKARSGEERFANVTCRLISQTASVAPQQSLTHVYRVFAGPKRPELLANYRAAANPGYDLGDLVYYGWFGNIAQAMVGILHFFYRMVGNYGLAIILLTVLVRGCMFPISRSQAKSMAKMQDLKPELDRLRDKYKGDQQRQAQEMQALYRKHGVNPLAGCLPMLIQLPIFLGLYRGLAVDIELRQAPLLGSAIRWCSNLAAPDMFFDWSQIMPKFVNSGQGMFALGPYLNLLPLVTIVLFLLQQKMFMPEPTNEQAAMQQKIMKYMMVFMGLLFYKVPSGLCIYFIASSLWGIAERKLVPSATAAAALAAPPRKADPAAASKPAAGPRGGAAADGDARRPKAKRRR